MRRDFFSVSFIRSRQCHAETRTEKIICIKGAKIVLLMCSSALAALVFQGPDEGSFAAADHRYKLAPESVLPAEIRNAPIEAREAYRFALANRNPLRYIPCYCSCGEQEPTSNASCYFMDARRRKKPVFDRMSAGFVTV